MASERRLTVEDEYNVASVKIYIDTEHDEEAWEQIDAVRLLTGGAPTEVTLSTEVVAEDEGEGEYFFVSAPVEHTAVNYRPGFRETLPADVRRYVDLDTAGEWQVHHIYQQRTDDALGRAFRDRLLINVHHPDNLVYVPAHIHSDITRAQETWWRDFRSQQPEATQRRWQNRALMYNEMPLAKLTEYREKMDALRQQYGRFFIPAGGTLADVNRARRSLGLPAYQTGRPFESAGSANAKQRFRRGTASRIRNWANIGLAVGAVSIFANIANGAAILNNIANPSPEVEQLFRTLLVTYDLALRRGVVQLGDDLWLRLFADSDAYLAGIGMSDQARASNVQAFLLFFQ